MAILGLQKAKKTEFLDLIFGIFLGIFGGLKRYGRICHRYIGKVTQFWPSKIVIIRSNCRFLVGGGTPRSRSRVKSSSIKKLILATTKKKHSYQGT